MEPAQRPPHQASASFVAGLALFIIVQDCSVAGFGASALVYPPNGSAFAATV